MYIILTLDINVVFRSSNNFCIQKIFFKCIRKKPLHFVSIGLNYSSCRNWLNAHIVGVRHTYVTYSHILPPF